MSHSHHFLYKRSGHWYRVYMKSDPVMKRTEVGVATVPNCKKKNKNKQTKQKQQQKTYTRTQLQVWRSFVLFCSWTCVNFSILQYQGRKSSFLSSEATEFVPGEQRKRSGSTSSTSTVHSQVSNFKDTFYY